MLQLKNTTMKKWAFKHSWKASTDGDCLMWSGNLVWKNTLHYCHFKCSPSGINTYSEKWCIRKYILNRACTGSTFYQIPDFTGSLIRIRLLIMKYNYQIKSKLHRKSQRTLCLQNDFRNSSGRLFTKNHKIGKLRCPYVCVEIFLTWYLQSHRKRKECASYLRKNFIGGAQHLI